MQIIESRANCTIPSETLRFGIVVLMRPNYLLSAIRLLGSSLLLGVYTAACAQSPTVQDLLRSGQAALDADDYAHAAASFELELAQHVDPVLLESEIGEVLHCDAVCVPLLPIFARS